MNQLALIKERQKDTAIRAGEVMAFAAKAQFENGVFIADETQRRESVQSAARGVPLFEGAPEAFTNQVSIAWSQSIAEYANKHGKYPSEDMLANAHRQVEKLLVESAKDKHTGFTSAMFEAANSDMRDSQGVMRQALFAALILPVALGATTGDMVTFVPCERDESDIYRIVQVAGSDFGHFKKADEINMQSAGEYSQFQHSRILDAAKFVAGATTDKVVTVKALETTDDEYGSAAGHAWPIRPGRCIIVVNGIRTPYYDSGDSAGSQGNIVVNAWPKAPATLSIDYDAGTFTIPQAAFNNLATTDVIGLIYELDVENYADMIPLINQKMKKFKVKPSQYALATEYTVQALFDAQREFGLDLSSQLFNGARNWLSHETDMKRLREALFCLLGLKKQTSTFSVALHQQQTMESWAVGLRQQMNTLSNEMVQRTLTSGIRGGFAGVEVTNLLRALPSTIWSPAPGYVESPYVQFAGTLFGVYRIYEVPAAVCAHFENVGLGLTTKSILFYGRGDNIGDAGLVAGDAVPAMPFIHPTTPALTNRTTLWGSAICSIHPDAGSDYFSMLNITGLDKIGVQTTGKP